MEQLDENKKKRLMKKLLLARFRLLNKYSFYGLLLMNAKFGLDLKCETAYTDGDKICFSPKFLDKLNEKEVEFILMHEVLHIVLKHCKRGVSFNNYVFNIACDIVVNSNILKSCNMDLNSITVREFGVSMHLAPDGKEGYNYTAEEVYYMLANNLKNYSFDSFDNHDNWMETDANSSKWDERLVASINALGDANKIPLGAIRKYKRMVEPRLNWKELLKNFLTHDRNDYGFTPPDRRYESDFFMPDFNEEIDIIKLNALFVIDTSGSITDDELNLALSEVKGALAEIDDINGYAICLDSKVYDPIPLNEFALDNFEALGGGGTSFIEFFNNLDNYKKMLNDKIDLIIFITDGEDIFPDEKLRQGIPVLWIINNDLITPPWGIVARL